jgi:4-amino-4-deoxy-L-arabinose transferase-like glycosyltransferase
VLAEFLLRLRDAFLLFFQKLTSGEWGGVVLLFPLAVVVFVVLFFVRYGRDMQPRAGTLEWIERLTPARFSWEGVRGSMTRADWYAAFGFTLVYASLAFGILLGNNRAPQTFWQATPAENAAVVDLGGAETVDTVMYYTGLWHGEWTLSFSEDGETWRDQPEMRQGYADLFKWQYAKLEETEQPTRYVRITSDGPPMELGEMVFVVRRDGVRTLPDVNGFVSEPPSVERLFDEQHFCPPTPTQLNGMIFDEVYHARTAYEYVRGVYPYETTHPPLGKGIISLGIRLFGMTPLGWRFMGTLFGVLMVPLLYVFVKLLFGRTQIAACGTALFAFETMHFTQTRLATIDTYGVFFTLLMYLCMYLFITSGYEAPVKKTIWPLALCGLSFGLGVASKWTGFYAAAGLVALYVSYLAARGRHQAAAGQKGRYLRFLLATLGLSVLFFVAVPFVIYLVSYLPYATAGGRTLTLPGLLDEMWRNQVAMFRYHAHESATHPFQSRWYQWLFDGRPILYYQKYVGATRAVIGAFTNPLTTLGGLAAVGACVLGYLRDKSRHALFIAVGYLAQVVPWLFVTRITFAYHYFPAMIFLILALCYVFNGIWERHPAHRGRVIVFTGVAAALFFLLFPAAAGIPMPHWYAENFVKWLPSWPF